MNEIKLFCPATVANLNCGFDVLGACLDTIGDEMIIRKTKERGIRISKITGADLPLEPEKNVAGVAALSIIKDLDTDFGFEIEIIKKIKPGSGIGSSAASAAGAVFGINELTGKKYSNHDLIQFASMGEEIAGGTPHLDNVSPALLGGFTIVRSNSPIDVLKINSFSDLCFVILHPHKEIKTSESRSVLPKNISLKDHVIQSGNLAGLISGLYSEDVNLISRSIQDIIVEPHRKNLIPHFDKITTIARQNAALGSGISGSGPSIFSLCEGYSTAKNIADNFYHFYSKTGIPYDIYISKINNQGIKIL